MSPTVTADDTLARAERALTDLIRLFNRPAVQHRLIAQAGLTLEISTCWALARLGDLGPSRPSELAASLGVDASAITHRLRTLEQAGYVERRPDPADGRACVVALSPAGQTALGRLRGARRAFVEHLLSGWDDDERGAFGSALERLHVALDAEVRQG